LPNVSIVSSRAYAGLAMTDFQVEHLADFGSSEPWVARVMLGVGDIIGATPLNGRDDVRDAFGEVFYALSDAFNDLRRLRDLVARRAPRSELDAAFSSFYVHLWRAYKDRFQKFVRTLGFDLGFLWMKAKDFNAIAPKFLAKHPDVDAAFIEMLINERMSWQDKFSVIRNEHLEHRKALPANFVAAFYTLEQAELLFANAWQAMEDIAAVLLAMLLPQGVVLREVPEAERDPAIPKRFGFAMTQPPTESS
jgi:hypothetical protein